MCIQHTNNYAKAPHHSINMDFARLKIDQRLSGFLIISQTLDLASEEGVLMMGVFQVGAILIGHRLALTSGLRYLFPMRIAQPKFM